MVTSLPFPYLRRALAVAWLGAAVALPVDAERPAKLPRSAAEATCESHASLPANQAPGATRPQSPPPASWRRITARSPRVEALREAQLALGEGDRLARESRLEEARKRWLAAAEAFRRAEEPLGTAEAYQNLANSHLFKSPEIDLEEIAEELGLGDPSAGIDFEKMSKILDYINLEAILNPEIFNRILDYYFAALFAGAEVYEPLIQKEISYDQEVLKRADELYSQGHSLYEAGDCGGAIALLDEALQLYEPMKYGAGQARALAIKMRCQMASSDVFGAMASMQEAMRVTAGLPVGGQNTERYLAAKELYQQGRLQEAEASYRELIKHYRETEDLSGLARAALDLGAVYASMEQYGKGEEMLLEALDLIGRLDEGDEYRSFNLAATRHNLGHLSVATGRPRQAIAHHCAALGLWRELGKPSNEAASLSGLGLVLRELGSYTDALAVMREGWALQQRLSPEPEIEGDLLNNIGYAHFSQGDYSQALDFYQQALGRRQQLPDGQKTIETLNNIASVYSAQGRFDDALAGYQKALEVARQQELPSHLTKVYGNIAGVQIQRGDYQDAIRTYLEALPIVIRNGDRPTEGMFRLNLSGAYQRLGDLASARDLLNEALAIFENIGNPQRIADVRGNLGALAIRTGDPDAAEHHLQEARRVLLDTKSATASRIVGNLALTAAARGDDSTAIEKAREALGLSRDAGNQADQVRFLLMMGILLLRQGDLESGLNDTQRTVDLASELGMAGEEVAGRAMLAVAHHLRNQHRKARRELATSIERLESFHGAITVPELKSGLLDQFFLVYDLAVLFSAEAGRPEEAFRFAEQARTRAFLDQLGNQRVDFRPGASTELIVEEQDQRRQLLGLQRNLAKELAEAPDRRNRERIRDLRRRQEAARTHYANLLTRLKVADPEYASLVSVDVLGLREVQSQILDEDTTLVEYFVTGASAHEALGGGAWAWVIDREGYRWVRLDVGKNLKAQVEYLRSFLSGSREETEFDYKAAATLYEMLVAPLNPYIQHRKVVLVPHGVLHYLPFAALWNAKEERFLLEERTLTLAPSASVLRFIARKGSSNEGRGLVLGNPDGSLVFAEAEATAVASLQGIRPLLGSDATESEVHARAGEVDLLHLAAHGIFDSVNPLFSRIELAPGGGYDGPLEAHEVFDLDLTGANLVVLSACDTALGEHSRGDELVGMTRAFLYAGSPAVVTSLWRVDDEASGELMKRFYRHLGEGTSAAEALRRAQLGVMAEERWRSPYFWAAFTLTSHHR
ncbi:MAG: CHAT domain-containing protein [bacterium]|nr:CHAT domain-containing protein [bacterium]